MNTVEDFDNVWTDERGIAITAPDILGLRYSFLDGEGEEHTVPVSWDRFHNYGDSLDIVAVFDRPVGGFSAMSVIFDHFNRETSVEVLDERGATQFMCWDMSPNIRGDLYHAVRFLLFLAYDSRAVREWSTDDNLDEWDTL